MRVVQLSSPGPSRDRVVQLSSPGPSRDTSRIGCSTPAGQLFNATIAAVNGNGGGKGQSNTVLVLVALVALLAGWSARQALVGEAMASIVTRIESMEKRQRKLGQAQTEALYLLTDSQRWNADTTRWLAQHLVPGAEPLHPRTTVSECERFSGCSGNRRVSD